MTPGGESAGLQVPVLSALCPLSRTPNTTASTAAATATRYGCEGRPLSDLSEGVGFQNSAIGSDLDFYAARSYSLTRPLRTGRRWIRFRERSATG